MYVDDEEILSEDDSEVDEERVKRKE